MARTADCLPENVAGDFYVDASCIDCETCRLLAPELFRERHDGLSFVGRQPASRAERIRAAMALVACPTSSIGHRGPTRRAEITEATALFPEPLAANVYFCGFTSESSFGAWSWLIRRPEGNVLVDSPRAARPLLDRIAALGGVRTMFLTHRDDVADHAVFRRRFACERVLHARDVTAGTRDVERRLEGEEPIALAPDLVAIPVPGHTPGSAALLYRDTFLFTGDHLWADDRHERLAASRSVCWYSWAEQVRSMERLREHRFEWVLPGHGAWFHAAGAAAMRAELDRLVATMHRH